jgi:hypothetical protein
MGGILNDYIIELIETFSTWLDSFFGEHFINIVLHPENTMDQIISDGNHTMVSALVSVCLNVGLSLIVLVFVKKGFETYVLWTDGDPDSEPGRLTVSFVKAMAASVSFPFLYGFLADIVSSFSQQLLKAILVGNVSGTNFNSGTFVSSIQTGGTALPIFAIIYVIICLLLYFQFIMRGIELLLLRIGFPLACIGLISSDKGIFAPYCNKIAQLMLAVVVQICLVKLSLALVVQTNFLWALACVFAALKIPAILSEFLYAGGGGGGLGGKMMAANQTVHLFRALVRR